MDLSQIYSQISGRKRLQSTPRSPWPPESSRQAWCINIQCVSWTISLHFSSLTRNSDNISDDYCKAMTLRDCVLFVKGTLNSFETTANVRLADLDFKHAHPDKVEKWKSTERDLISQGWYTHVAADQASAPVCLLARRSL
jgi:hypothetical protein